VAFPTLSLDGEGRVRVKKNFQYPLIPAFPHRGGKVKEGKRKSTLAGESG
jgi:hypothetical protein